MKKIIIALFCVSALLFVGCGNDGTDIQQGSQDILVESINQLEEAESTTVLNEEEKVSDEDITAKAEEITVSENRLVLEINQQRFTATLEDNEAVQELILMMEEGPITIEMSDYAGFEKVGPLGQNLTTSNQEMTTEAGDIVLYNGSNICIYYGTNTWSFTKLAHIDDLTGWEEVLGSGDVTVEFSIESVE